MRNFLPRCFPLVLVLLAAAISSSGCAPPAITLKTIGTACAADADCGSTMCSADKICTRSCAVQGDCPTGFDCRQKGPIGAPATCYKATYATAVKGGFGEDCSAFSPDPKTAVACNVMAANPCADGFGCRSLNRCDPDAFCTKGCATDFDCPPTMFCGVDVNRNHVCKMDSDCGSGATCSAPPGGSGSIKICQRPAVCLKRTACSTCGVDDQCPAGTLCAVDKTGEKYCGQRCNGDVDCPPPANDSHGAALSDLFQKCVDAGNGSASKVCQPRSGSCHGVTAIASLQIQTNTVCSACRVGVPGDCPEGFCYEDAFNLEHFCTIPCTIQVKSEKGSTFTVAADTDSCPMGAHCQGIVQAKPPSTASGVCGADTNPGTSGYQTYLGTTCYPLPM